MSDSSGNGRPGSDVPDEGDVGQHLSSVLGGSADALMANGNGGRKRGKNGSQGGGRSSGGRRSGGGGRRGLGWLDNLSGSKGLVTVSGSEGGTPAPVKTTDAASEKDALREAILGDPVVRALLPKGVVTGEQVRVALKRKTPQQPLWQAVALLGGADERALYRGAYEHGEPMPAVGPTGTPLAPAFPSEAFGRRVSTAMRSGIFELRDAPRSDVSSLVAAGLLPGLENDAASRPSGGDASVEASVDGHALEQEPVPSISEQWADDAEASGEETLEEAFEEVPEEVEVETNDRVVSTLLRGRLVTAEQVREAQARQEKEGGSEALWRVLAQGSGVDRGSVFAQAARVYAFPIADLQAQEPDPEFTRKVAGHFSDARREQLLELGVVPWRVEVDRERSSYKLYLITHDPARPAVHRLAHALDIDRVELLYASEEDVQALIADAFPRTNEYLERVEDDAAMDLGATYEEDDDLVDEEALEAEISRSKLINLFEATLMEAVREGASDIHIFPNPKKEIEIHFRVDGRLQPWHTERKVHPEALLAVIKDNSMNVDRFEKDTAQDGFIQRTVDGALIRFRVSVMPIASAAQDVRAESIVIRVLDDRKVITDLSKLGLLENALERFRHAIAQPHGMVIMTGPTGSGKSTTLVAALHEVVNPDVNVLTVEDPVEYVINDVRQIKLSHKLKLRDALRSILRHDPDIVMVGEMRDRETAELAIKLANTGHLTFSTLHTNDAPSAVNRLYKMGIEPFLIAYAINLVVAQRLIRTLCPECKQIDPDPDPVMLERLGFGEEEIEEMEFFEEGDDPSCPTCNGFGYKGRRAISEALHFSRAIRHMIVEAGDSIDEEGIRQQAVSDGMFTLQGSARQVVKKGQTSIGEMMRVVATES